MTTGGGNAGQASRLSLDGIRTFRLGHLIGKGEPHANLRSRRTTKRGDAILVDVPRFRLGPNELQCPFRILVGGGKRCDGGVSIVDRRDGDAGFDRVVDVGQPVADPAPISLRMAELERILGIPIPADFVAPTLTNLGLEITGQTGETVTATPPSWRHDLTREIDLVEEVGRIYGYDKVPDTAEVPMVASYLPKRDRVLERVRNVLTGAGFDEALTASFVPEPWSDAISPWTDEAALVSTQPMLGVLEKASQNIGAVDRIRRSLIPSLLEARRINEYRSNTDIELFETAKVYLPKGGQEIPEQPTMVSLVSGRDFFEVKSILLEILNRLNPNQAVELVPLNHALLDVNLALELWVGKEKLGLIGQVSDMGKQQFKLRAPAVVAECRLDLLETLAVLIPLHHNQSPFPPISRDFNFVVDEAP